MDLSLYCAVVLIFSIAMYILLDGFDLGIGILFWFCKNEAERDVMMASIAPVWDGNETWLVLGGTTIFAAFPRAYGLLLPASYIPVILFLFALIFRGVAFEFRGKSRRRFAWNVAFSAGSTGAAFMQGMILGQFIRGYQMTDGHYTGGIFGWVSPFSALAGVAVVCGYALLGAAWLIGKTEGDLQEWCYRMALRLVVVVLGFIALVSIFTPYAYPDIRERWFAMPNVLYLLPIPVLTALDGWWLWRTLVRRRPGPPFPLSIGLFLLSYLGLGVSLWPYVVPRSVTIWQAASGPAAQEFYLIGVLIFVPLVLLYTGYAYWVFRGKASPSDSYH